MDLRYHIPLESAHLVGANAELSDMGIPGALRIQEGNPDSSILYLRMIDTTVFRMPPLATSLIDDFGTNLVRAWIDTLGLALSIAANQNIVNEFALYPAYPNPFNPVTNISYQIPSSGFISLKIYNILGQEVATLVAENQTAGTYHIRWDASGMASGIYLCRLYADNKSVQMKKLMLLK